MSKAIGHLAREESGVVALEFALTCCLVGTAFIVGGTMLAPALGDFLTTTRDLITEGKATLAALQGCQS